MFRAAPVRRDAALGADLTPLEWRRAEQHARRARRGDGESSGSRIPLDASPRHASRRTFGA